MDHDPTPQSLDDDALLRRLGELVSRSRCAEADVVAHVGEVEARRLYAREAAPSMFAYCTRDLHFSEAEAYARIRVARAARRHPVLLAMLRDGRLHLSGLVRLVPHLTRENCDRLLARAIHKSKRQIEELVAELFPQPDAPTVVRKLPARRVQQPASAPPRGTAPEAGPLLETDGPVESVRAGENEANLQLCPGTVHQDSAPRAAAIHNPRPDPCPLQPLAPARYKVQFTAGAGLRDKLDRLQSLLRREHPDVDLATAIEMAVTEKLERLEARRYAATRAPRKRLSDADPTPVSRYIPAPVRRAVRQRDGDRCQFVDARGRRCDERVRLELHHRYPFGLGGDHSVGNLELLCRGHNAYLAERDYGREAVRRHRGPDEICNQASDLPPGQ